MPRGQRETMTARAAALKTSGYSSSRPSSVCCFESLSRDKARLSESVRRSRSNRTAAATSGPASDPRPASSAPAMKRRSKARSKANRRRPARTALERADPVRGPVREERLPDDPSLRDWSPVAAIVAFPTVVAHHKKVPRRNRDLPGLVADGTARIGADVRLVELLAVDVGAALDHLQAIAGEPDDPLDEVRVGLLRSRLRAGFVGRFVRVSALGLGVRSLGRLEDNDVAAMEAREVLGDAVDQDTLPDRECRLHRPARDAVRLDDEGLDPQREAERHRDDRDELDCRARRALLLFALRHRASRNTPRASRLLGRAVLCRGLFRGCFVGLVGCFRGGLGRGFLGARLLSGLGRGRLCLRGLSLGLLRGSRLLSLLRLGGSGPLGCQNPRVGLRTLLIESLWDDVDGLWTRVLALANARPAANPAAEVVELRPPHIASACHFDPLDLRRMQGERSLHANAKRLLADGERLARARPLSLEDDALEHLRAATRSLDDLEMNLHPVAGLELRYALELRALEGCDDVAHDKRSAPEHGRRPGLTRCRSMVSKAEKPSLACRSARAHPPAALLETPLADLAVVARQ